MNKRILYKVRLIREGWNDEVYILTNKEEAYEAVKKMNEKGFKATVQEFYQ